MLVIFQKIYSLEGVVSVYTCSCLIIRVLPIFLSLIYQMLAHKMKMKGASILDFFAKPSHRILIYMLKSSRICMASQYSVRIGFTFRIIFLFRETRNKAKQRSCFAKFRLFCETQKTAKFCFVSFRLVS
jgi:hypothetical protein